MSTARDGHDQQQRERTPGARTREDPDAKEADILLRQINPNDSSPTAGARLNRPNRQAPAANGPRGNSLEVPSTSSSQARQRRQKRASVLLEEAGNGSAVAEDDCGSSLSLASTTSEVNSDDDAASIASRLSQIVSEQEFMLTMNSAVGAIVCERREANGPQRQRSANESTSESAARAALSRGAMSKSRLHHRSASSLALDGAGSSRRGRARSRSGSESASGIKISSNSNTNSASSKTPRLHQVDSSLETGQRAPEARQDDQEARVTFQMGADDHECTLGAGRQPERGHLKALESARQRQLASSQPANKLDRGDGDLIVNICRSAWTLEEFEQTFKPESEESAAPNGPADGRARLASSASSELAGAGPPGADMGAGGFALERQPAASKNLLIRATINAVMQGGSGAGQPGLAAAHSNCSLGAQGPLGERRHSHSNQLEVPSQWPMGRETRAMSVASSCASSVDSSRSRKPFAAISTLLGSSRLRKARPSGTHEHSNENEEARADQRCGSSTLETIQQYVPIVEWLPNYKLAYFWGDLTSGSAVAVLNISLCLSAAVVAETDMGAAFRASIVNTFFYALLASSRHTSFGSWSIMSQMLLDSVRRALSDELVLNRINMGPSASWSAEEYEMWHMNIIIMYTFLIGLMQFLGGALSLGNILASFIPEALCSSMIAACAFTMAIGQLANMCGTSNKILWAIEKNTTELSWAHLKDSPLSITDLFAGLFRWIQQIALLIKHHEQINVICVIISLVSLILLTLNQTVLQRRVRALFNKKNLFVPFELILLISMIIVSYVFNLKAAPYNVTTCGPIFIEFEMPNLPNLRLVRELWFHAIATALISFTMVYIMSRTYSNKLNYEIDANQELIACGAGNLFGGLFDALPATGSFSRTASAVEAGAQTQMSSLVNCAVLFFLAQLFGHHVAQLPVCVMSAALFFSFVRMMTRITDALLYWRLCKVDFAIWMVTFVAIISLDLVNGFVYSFIFSILTVLYRAQNRRCYLLGTIGTSDVYVPLAKYPLARELDGIKIFQFCGPIHYVSADLFERLLRQKTRVNVKQILHNRELEATELAVTDQGGGSKQAATIKASNLSNGHQVLEYNQASAAAAAATPHQQPPSTPSHILLDFSMISFIDSAGVHVLKKIITDYQRVNITVMCASLASHVATVVKNERSLWDTHKDRFYVTLADAVHHAVRDRAEKLRRNMSTVSLQLNGNQSFD